MKQHSVKLSDELTLVIKKTIQKQHKSPINQFEFIKVEEKNWPSSALGCPKSGMQYMQMMTPGYLVRVKADGIAHSVHTSLKHAVLCGQSKPDGLTHRTSEKPKVEASTLNRIKAIQLSRATLIQAKDIVANKVRLKSVNDALFNDLKTKCKGNYAGKNSGFRVVLSHENLEAIFFSDGKEVIKCSSQTKL